MCTISLHVTPANANTTQISLTISSTIHKPSAQQFKMASFGDKGGKDFGEGPKIHKIRITLTSKDVKSLEKVCSELIERAKTKQLSVKGPVRLPTKNLKISTRKTPNGEGSKTWDLFEMRIHKRLIE